ncbi:MAG: hypothetical protein ACD_49C00049G0017 [uncultured bacterium (gcode 4)]|uniref:Uncharacterized protein n=1 Tax=uncultured bacterium (gcode 4) TaxID=1234023 RepID=K2BVU3_9BACT|nr:MAG: hypothetical protein ACD_49C00049G0017 [uncultured bacterium (gcode 4)]
MKNILIKFIILWLILIISIYSFPIINCIVNKTTTCYYPFYERTWIESKLLMSKKDLISNKEFYNGLIDFIKKQWYSTIEKGVKKEIIYTIPWDISSDGFLKKYSINKDIMILNRKIYDIFENLWINTISDWEDWIRISKDIFFLKRWFHQWYLFSKTWDLYKDKEVIYENDNKVIYEKTDDLITKIILIDNNWSFVTIQSIISQK